jgi:hypothetical protein
MGIKVANNANATLAASITSSATSITVTSGQGARFPTLSAGDYFYATLIDVSNNLEIVKVTARSTDVLTVTRAQESTTARAYSTGDRIELRLTAQTFIDAALAVLPSTVSDQANTSTGYFDLPSGTTAQRPASPNAGMIRHNTTTGYIEYWDTVSSSWIGLGAFQATGGTVSQSGSYTYHTFTSSGTFTVTSGARSIEYLIVAGGGSSQASQGQDAGGGGGGAGGYVTGTVTAVGGNYSVTVGAGGAPASNGADSVFNGITAVGGGRGGAYNGVTSSSGGSGGGAAYSVGASAGTSGQGNAGGNAGQGSPGYGGGGGGGANAAGGNCPGTDTPGDGGAGKQWSNGSYYAGGGGGATRSAAYTSTAPGSGGVGGGGQGSGAVNSYTGVNGTANTGGGAGGTSASTNAGRSGGSGIVIIRYLT